MDPEFIELYLDMMVEKGLVKNGLPLINTSDGLAIAVRLDDPNNLVTVRRPDLDDANHIWRMEALLYG